MLSDWAEAREDRIAHLRLSQIAQNSLEQADTTVSVTTPSNRGVGRYLNFLLFELVSPVLDISSCKRGNAGRGGSRSESLFVEMRSALCSSSALIQSRPRTSLIVLRSP